MPARRRRTQHRHSSRPSDKQGKKSFYISVLSHAQPREVDHDSPLRRSSGPPARVAASFSSPSIYRSIPFVVRSQMPWRFAHYRNRRSRPPRPRQPDADRQLRGLQRLRVGGCGGLLDAVSRTMCGKRCCRRRCWIRQNLAIQRTAPRLLEIWEIPPDWRFKTFRMRDGVGPVFAVV